MKKLLLYFYFTLFCMILATPGESLYINEMFLGITKNSYYTLITENENSGSYTEWTQNLYLTEYQDNMVKNKKILKKEKIKTLDGNLGSAEHKIIKVNNKEINKLISENIVFLQPLFVNEKSEIKYEARKDGIYEINIKDQKEIKLFSKEEIDKKLEDTCKERCSKLPEYNNGNLKVITYYTEAHSRYYLMKIYLDMAEANVIMKYSLVI